MKPNEEIDTGQVLSAQDISDMQALRRKVRRMRINMDNYPKGSKEEAELFAQIRAANQQIQKYYQRVNQLRNQYGLNQPKGGTIKMNEEQLRSLIAESVKKVLKEGKWHISETMNMLGDIKLICRFLQNNYESIDSSDEADAIHETVQNCLRELWHIAKQFGYC